MTPNDLIKLGIKPGPIFGQILSITAGMSEVEAFETATRMNLEAIEAKKAQAKKFVVKDGSVLKWFLDHEWVRPITKENRPGNASNSEMKRWLDNGSIFVNGVAAKADDMWPEELTGLVFFPGRPLQITMW